MPTTGRDRDGSTDAADPSTEVGPAVRDAARAVERVTADEVAAAEARRRLADGRVPAMDADEVVTPHLAQGEIVHALRTSAILLASGDEHGLGYGGTLYLTSHRLLLIGQVMVSVKLADIVETSLAGERLLISVRSGEGLRLDVDRPRLLRTEMAAAVREVRS